MVFFSKHYTEAGVAVQLQAVINDVLKEISGPPVILCIGSDRHVLDCFGPLTGSMLNKAGISVPVYGDLDHPLHASNIPRELRLIQEAHHDRFEIAIDASVGAEVEIGTIKVRRGSLLPAKAVGKRLPAVGELAITGVVGIRHNQRTARPITYGSLAHVYHMACLVSQALIHWDATRSGNKWS